MSLPSDREFPKTGAVSPHHSGSSWGEDRREALIFTSGLHLLVLISHLRANHSQRHLVYPPRGPTHSLTFSIGLGEMKYPFLNYCQGWLNVRNLELGALAAKVLRANSISQEV